MSALVVDASLDSLPLEVTFSVIMCSDVFGIPHDAVGWARRNIPVSMGGSVARVCWAALRGPPRVRLVVKGA